MYHRAHERTYTRTQHKCMHKHPHTRTHSHTPQTEHNGLIATVTLISIHVLAQSRMPSQTNTHEHTRTHTRTQIDFFFISWPLHQVVNYNGYRKNRIFFRKLGSLDLIAPSHIYDEISSFEIPLLLSALSVSVTEAGFGRRYVLVARAVIGRSNRSILFELKEKMEVRVPLTIISNC